MKTIKINLNSLKRPTWTEQESKNVELIHGFVQSLMNDHDFKLVLEEYGNQSYVQHNRGLPDGIDGLTGYLKKFTKRFPEYAYDVKHIYADGDFVTFHSHATMKASDRGNDKKGFNIIDTWKIKDGEIVEHWDSIQPLNSFMRFYIWLIGGRILNQNGVF